jgi:hypothetical protein
LDQSLRAYRESIHAKIVYQLNGCENVLQKMMKQWGLDSFPTKHTGCPIATYVSFQEATAFCLVGTFFLTLEHQFWASRGWSFQSSRSLWKFDKAIEATAHFVRLSTY